MPFVFVIDYQKKKFIIDKLDTKKILYNFDGLKNYTPCKKEIILKKYPISKDKYKKAFDIVQEHIASGNSYLLNLTFATKIELNATIKELFLSSNAKFQVYVQEDDIEFTCFSPERFVKIENNKIYTYPMKGTIDSTIPNAKEIILNNKKELAEHTMVVDLLRNDLGMIGTRVRVDEFRYIDKVVTQDSSIYQVSSQISASLSDNWQDNIGTLLDTILPAGSITGTPKHKTIEIIDQVEISNRDFFTGVCGYFDGDRLDSGVMIRYIQKQDDGYYYKSGGGITSDSDIESEYEEMIKKVYITKG